MAYGFGTTVNPQLGAVDYSNYLRGALTGAQMEAEGGAAIGRGIASGLSSIGSEIGSGMKQYAENKKKLKTQEGSIKSVSNLFSSALNVEQKKGNPQAEIVTFLQDALSKLNDPSASVDERYAFSTNAVTGLSNIIQLGAQSAKEQEDKNAAQYGNLLRRFNGNIPSIVDTRGFTATQKAAGTNQYLNQRLIEQKGTPPPPKTPKPENLTFQEQAFAAQKKALEASLGREANDQEIATLYRDIMRTASPTGDPAETARMDLIAKELPRLGENADSARRIMPNLSSLQKKLDAGLKTGKLEDFKTDAMAFANSLGIAIDEAALGSSESARAQFGQFLLEYFAATKGAITERENALFASMGPQFSKSNEANKDLLSLVEARLKLDLELGNIYRDGLSSGMGLVEINRDLQKARNKFEERYNSTFDKLEDKYVTGDSPPEGVPLSTWNKMTPEGKALWK